MSQRQESSRKQRTIPAGLHTIRPDAAGIDVGSQEHWVCGPAREDGEPQRSGVWLRPQTNSLSWSTGWTGKG